MSEECRLEECALSIEPSSICAQFASTITLVVTTRVSGVGCQTGGSNSGIALTGRPVFSVQHHPEASPGPQDSHYLFRRFVNLIRARKGEAALAER